MKKNIIFIMSDDHGAGAISCYGSKINSTPNIDRIAQIGARLDACMCTNSICAPSRAVILTGRHSHLNGVTTLATHIDSRQSNVAKELQANGYQTAIIGKWHMGNGGIHDPQGFDYWNILYGQGPYYNPTMCQNGSDVTYEGYTTEIITELTLDFIDKRDKDKPFMVMCHHKAPHRNCIPAKKYEELYKDEDLYVPDTFFDDFEGRSDAVKYNEMSIHDLKERDTKKPVPKGLSEDEVKKWKYQEYFKDYLRCVASVDESVGDILDYLEDNNLMDDTVVIYTSDQGFFIGDHGFFDKRYMLEESMKMPFVICAKGEIPPNSVVKGQVANLDFAPTFLDYAEVDAPEYMQGISVRKLLEGKEDEDSWVNDIYYRYWTANGEHGVSPHYGIRTKDYKLICYLDCARDFDGNIIKGQENSKWPQWELFDMNNDLEEVNNLYCKEEYKDTVEQLTKRLFEIKHLYKD